MDFSVLKLGFQTYLQDKLAEQNQEVDFSLSDISIFMYADEFKEYITDELKISSSLYSVGINDILEMELDESGKLVNPNANDEVSENPESTTDLTEETQSQENAEATDSTTEQDPNMLANIMNDLLQDKTFTAAIDADSDGEVTDEELDAFLNAIKGNDNDETNLSLDDLLTATQQIKDNKFSLETPNEETVEQIETPAQTPQLGNTGGGGFTPTQNNNNNNNNNKQPQATESIEGKTLQQLQDMLPTREGRVESAQDAVDEAIDAVNNNEAKEALDEAFNNYVEFLEQIEEEDAKFAEQIKDKNGEIEESQAKIDDYDKQLADCAIKESELESTISDADASIAELNGTKDSLNAAISSAESDEEKNALKGRLSNIEDAIKAQEDKKQQAEDELKVLQEETVPEIEENKQKETEHLATLEGELEELMAAAEEEYPELAEYRTAYDEAKVAYEEEKITAQENLDTAYENLATAQIELNELNSAISVAETKEVQKANNATLEPEYDEEEGQRLVDTAHAMLDKYGETHGLCATGVHRTIQMAYGISMGGNGCDWDTNMEKLVAEGMFKEVTGDYATSADLTNLPAGAVVCWENTGGTNGGGAQYGHVCIADGKGGEISDHYQTNIYQSVGGRSDQYRVFIPV